MYKLSHEYIWQMYPEFELRYFGEKSTKFDLKHEQTEPHQNLGHKPTTRLEAISCERLGQISAHAESLNNPEEQNSMTIGQRL